MELFNVNNPQADILETTAQRVLMHCGVGVGKSHCIGIVAFEFACRFPTMRGMIAANTYSQLSKSTLDRVFKVWEDIFKIKKGIHYVVDMKSPSIFTRIGASLKSYENTISFNNGAMIFTSSLENYKVLDGTEFGWCCLDETKDTREEAVKEVIVARLRQICVLVHENGLLYLVKQAKAKCKSGEWKFIEEGNYYEDEAGKKITGYNPLYIFTSPAKVRWISNWFKLEEQSDEIQKTIFSKTNYYRKLKDNMLVVIASSYHNERNLSSGYIETLKSDLGQNKSLIDMLIYGSPFGKTGGEFYSAYSRDIHVKKIIPNENLAVHISLDFNVVPYITMTLWQVEQNLNKFKVRAFAELCLPAPKNNIESLCKEADARFGHLFKNGLYYYGDYSGKNGQTMTADFKNHYSVLENVLYKYLNNGSDRVIVNPNVMKRRNFVNKMFSGGFPIDIEIDTDCQELKGDMEFLQEGADGNKSKKRVMDKNRGISYEEHGHTSDSMDYFLCSLFEAYYKNA